MKKSWKIKFIDLAELISSWSKDPSTKVGVVAINPKNNNVLSTGFNGFPRGLNDTAERLASRETKYKYTVHAEANCIYNATKNGVSLDNSYMFVYGLCVCSDCALALAQTGVKKILYREADEERSLCWKESTDLSKRILKEAGVEIEKI